MNDEHTQIEPGDITRPALSAGQFEKIRLQLGLDDEQLSDALGLSSNGAVAIGKMRRRQKAVSGPVATSMMAFVSGFRPPWYPNE